MADIGSVRKIERLIGVITPVEEHLIGKKFRSNFESFGIVEYAIVGFSTSKEINGNSPSRFIDLTCSAQRESIRWSAATTKSIIEDGYLNPTAISPEILELLKEWCCEAY